MDVLWNVNKPEKSGMTWEVGLEPLDRALKFQLDKDAKKHRAENARLHNQKKKSNSWNTSHETFPVWRKHI